MQTYTAKITNNGKTQHCFEIIALSYSNARLTAGQIKESKGYTGLLTVTSKKPGKKAQKVIFDFKAEIYKLDSRGQEILNADGEPIVIEINNLSSKEEALKMSHLQAPTMGCMGYKIVVLEAGEEIYCQPVMF
jgi:hypothetical protein